MNLCLTKTRLAISITKLGSTRVIISGHIPNGAAKLETPKPITPNWSVVLWLKSEYSIHSVVTNIRKCAAEIKR